MIRPRNELIGKPTDGTPAHRSDPERQALLREARGLWRHRDDLPDFRPLRQELDRSESTA